MASESVLKIELRFYYYFNLIYSSIQYFAIILLINDDEFINRIAKGYLQFRSIFFLHVYIFVHRFLPIQTAGDFGTGVLISFMYMK